MVRGKASIVALVLVCTVRAEGASPSIGERVRPDPLALARLSRDVGDRVLLDTLQAESPKRRDVLAALWAAPFATEPETLLPAICRWAATRDPQLAPTAGRSLLQIARQLDPDALSVREATLASLDKARAAIQDLLGHEPAVREDIAFAAAFADTALAELLRQLGVEPNSS